MCLLGNSNFRSAPEHTKNCVKIDYPTMNYASRPRPCGRVGLRTNSTSAKLTFIGTILMRCLVLQVNVACVPVFTLYLPASSSETLRMRIFACNTDSQIGKLSQLDVLTRGSGMKRGIDVRWTRNA